MLPPVRLALDRALLGRRRRETGGALLGSGKTDFAAVRRLAEDAVAEPVTSPA